MASVRGNSAGDCKICHHMPPIPWLKRRVWKTLRSLWQNGTIITHKFDARKRKMSLSSGPCVSSLSDCLLDDGGVQLPTSLVGVIPSLPRTISDNWATWRVYDWQQLQFSWATAWSETGIEALSVSTPCGGMGCTSGLMRQSHFKSFNNRGVTINEWGNSFFLPPLFF